MLYATTLYSVGLYLLKTTSWLHGMPSLLALFQHAMLYCSFYTQSILDSKSVFQNVHLLSSAVKQLLSLLLSLSNKVSNNMRARAHTHTHTHTYARTYAHTHTNFLALLFIIMCNCHPISTVLYNKNILY